MKKVLFVALIVVYCWFVAIQHADALRIRQPLSDGRNTEVLRSLENSVCGISFQGISDVSAAMGTYLCTDTGPAINITILCPDTNVNCFACGIHIANFADAIYRDVLGCDSDGDRTCHFTTLTGSSTPWTIVFTCEPTVFFMTRNDNKSRK